MAVVVASVTAAAPALALASSASAPASAASLVASTTTTAAAGTATAPTAPASTATASSITAPSTTARTAAATPTHTRPAPTPTPMSTPTKPGPAAKPYLGWSSWSLQSTNYPGVNTDGPGSYITAEHITQQADAMAAKLKPYGYEYVNMDAGWQDGVDQYGRPAVNTKRFPDGVKPVVDHIHSLGLKSGIYTVVGLGDDAYNGGTTPIYGAPGCHTSDIVYPDLRKTNGWDSAYKIDYASSCAQSYADSIADLFAAWGVDFVKMDGIGPGSFKGGPNYDNQDDIRAWNKAIVQTKRPMQYVLSWSLSHKNADTWTANSNGSRIDTDVECYCNTLVTWNESVKQRWNDVVQWIPDARPGYWNNLDAIDVGVGEMDGLTNAERQSAMTLWAIESAPLFSGDDLTKLDAYGLSLLTNREVLAIDQAGIPAKPVDQKTQQQTWFARNADGSVTAALFNLSDAPAKVTANLRDIGISGAAKVRDVWKKTETGTARGTISATLPAHGSQLLTLRPTGGSAAAPTGLHATASTPTSVSLAWDALTGKAASQGQSYTVSANGRPVLTTSSTSATVAKLAVSSTTSFTVAVTRSGAAGSSSPLRLTTPASSPTSYQAEAAQNVLTGTASRGGCAHCSSGGKVGNLGGDSTLTVTGVHVAVTGDYLVKIAYVDADSSRQGVVSVNGQPAQQVNYAGSGDNDWDSPQTQSVILHLNAGDNTVGFSSPDSYSPDIDALTL